MTITRVDSFEKSWLELTNHNAAVLLVSSLRTCWFHFCFIRTGCSRLSTGSGRRDLRGAVKVWRSPWWEEATVRARLRRVFYLSSWETSVPVNPVCKAFAQESDGKEPDLFIAQQKGCRAVDLLQRLDCGHWQRQTIGRGSGGCFVWSVMRWKKTTVCGPDIQILTTGVWPFYMPQVFSHQHSACLHLFFCRCRCSVW